jgi:uncharacterized protein (TIGR03083 family)
MAPATVSSFVAAAEWFLGIADRDEVAEGWSSPSAVSGFTVGGLVGHVAAAVAWIAPLLAAPAPDDARTIGLGEYCLPFAAPSAADLAGEVYTAVRAQGERGAQRGAVETVVRLRTRVDQLREQLSGADRDRLLDLRPTLPCAIRLDDFLKTRVLELVVHGDDLAATLGLTLAPPEDAAAVTLETLIAAARSKHGDVEVIRAFARAERCTVGVVPIL